MRSSAAWTIAGAHRLPERFHSHENKSAGKNVASRAASAMPKR